MPSPRIPCLLLGLAGGLLAQPTGTSARIIGAVPDGTPPSPEPSKPGFTCRPQQVRSEKIHHQGGRDIIVRTIDSMPAPSSLPSAPRIDPQGPEIRRLIERPQADAPPDGGLILMGATVFILPDGKVRTLIHLWPPGGTKSSAFWSSADFRLLAPLHRIACDDGFQRSLIVAWGEEPLSADKAAALDIPAFPEEGATFRHIGDSATPTAAFLSLARSLHAIHDKDHAALLAAFQSRGRETLRREAEAKANPPRPKNVNLHTWTLRAPSAGQTSAKGGER